MDERIEVRIQPMRDRKNITVQWYDAAGKRCSRSTGTTDPKQAEQFRADLEYELNRGIHHEPSKLSWQAFRELFEREFLPGRRAGTARNYRQALADFERICSPPTLRSVTERTVSQFVAGLWAQPGRGKASMMASTIKTKLQFLRTVLLWAAAQKFIAAAPKFPTVKPPRKRPQSVPEADVRRLLDAAGPQFRAFLLCAWLAGLRLNEAFTLEWLPTDTAPWLDLDRPKPRIVFPAAAVKGDEDQWVPLDPELQAALVALPRAGPRVFRFVGANGAPVALGALSVRTLKLARRLGLALNYKALRRGFGCRHAARVPAQTLQKLMRHSDIKVTLAYYANLDAAVEDAIFGDRTTGVTPPGDNP